VIAVFFAALETWIAQAQNKTWPHSHIPIGLASNIINVSWIFHKIDIFVWRKYF
jgi:hypothetical protein